MKAVDQSDRLPPPERLGRLGRLGRTLSEDAKENKRALEQGARIFSSYGVGDGKVWIITEADRSATTVLLPEA